MGLSFLVQYDKAIVQVGFWMCIAFVLGVSTFWGWWTSDFGWTIVLKVAGIGLLLLPSTIMLELGIDADTLAWQWVASCGLTFVTIILPWRAWTIWKRQRYIKRNGGERDQDGE